MKHLLSGAIGATMMFLVMWLTMGEQSDCRSIQAGYEQQLEEAQWEAKIAQHRLAKTQRELGEQLARKVGTLDDVMKANIKDVKAMPCGDVWPAIPCTNMSKIDAEVSSITALAKPLTAMEAEARKGTELIDLNPAPRSWWHQVKPVLFRLAAGRW